MKCRKPCTIAIAINLLVIKIVSFAPIEVFRDSVKQPVSVPRLANCSNFRWVLDLISGLCDSKDVDPLQFAHCSLGGKWIKVSQTVMSIY